MAKEEIVVYQGIEYIIIHQYDSGYVEIRKLKGRNIELVHESEINHLSNSDS